MRINFMIIDWCEAREVEKFQENVFLSYFGDNSKNLKTSKFLFKYPLMKQTSNIKNNIGISHYAKLIGFLLQNSQQDTKQNNF